MRGGTLGRVHGILPALLGVMADAVAKAAGAQDIEELIATTTTGVTISAAATATPHLLTTVPPPP